MANANFTASHQGEPEALKHELNEIAARLSGVEEILIDIVDGAESKTSSLYLIATAIADANNKISLAAGRVGNLVALEAGK